MSQPNSWDSAEHFALVLELSKPVIYGAAVAALDKVLKYGLDYETPLHNTLVTWGRVLDTLTETQKAILEVERPGIVLRMSTNLEKYVPLTSDFYTSLNILRSLGRSTAFFSAVVKNERYFGYILPGTKAAAKAKQVAEMFKLAEGDFMETSQRFWPTDRDNAVSMIISADRAASQGINVEMNDLAASLEPSVTSPSTHANTSTASLAIQTRPPRVPEDVHFAYRSAVALSAALLPAFLRRGRRGSPYNGNRHPV
ncbi:hypothetical protein TRAPUB_14155 [Trametes pubescens]|uniref:Uncharacterized protein n=1 Tax=Trametes pubescens TaxID=154538 RepID=A0A1M2VP66_TRAPU|nr:hypothetical protein TRAPUB_14155 [Trametes pubescens]